MSTDQRGRSRSLEGLGLLGAREQEALSYEAWPRSCSEKGQSQDSPQGLCVQVGALRPGLLQPFGRRGNGGSSKLAPDHLVLRGTAVQAWALFWVLDPKILHLYSTALREALTDRKMELGVCRNVTRDHVAGAWAGASMGGMHMASTRVRWQERSGVWRGPALTEPWLHAQGCVWCWRPGSALCPSLELCGSSGNPRPLPATLRWPWQCGLAL